MEKLPKRQKRINATMGCVPYKIMNPCLLQDAMAAGRTISLRMGMWKPSGLRRRFRTPLILKETVILFRSGSARLIWKHMNIDFMLLHIMLLKIRKN